MDNTSLFPSGMVCVGMWKDWIYHHVNSYNRTIGYHHYTYHDTYLPFDTRVSQILLMVTSLLGLLGRTSIIFSLRNVFMVILKENATVNYFLPQEF